MRRNHVVFFLLGRLYGSCSPFLFHLLGGCLIPVPLDSTGKTEVILVLLNEGGCYIWLARYGGSTQRNHSQPGFWQYLVSQISWKSASLGPSKAETSGLQGCLAWPRSCSAQEQRKGIALRERVFTATDENSFAALCNDRTPRRIKKKC